ncbi:alpha/beta hydrolase [Nocardia grenadensis]|uniref:alpha/beta hydrolase n=1 Tax=Nocardia grenadensis TaxID=931537 RepID=UPI003D8A3034
MLLLDAAYDSLSASSTTFAGELTDAGIENEHVIVPGTRHGFLNRPRSAGFRYGTETLVRWLDRLT